VKSQKCPYHVTFDLDLDLYILDADKPGTIVCKFGGDPAICLREEAIYTNVYRQTDKRTDGRRTPHDGI